MHNYQKHKGHAFASLLLVLFSICFACAPDARQIKVDSVPGEKRIDVSVNGELFTSYLYGDDFEKPFLFPVVAANGTVVSRGYPIDSREGEAEDHPHQTGFWFTYGNVNGIDYWGNSKAIPDSLKSHYGIVRLKAIEKAGIEDGKGIIKVSQEWVNPDGSIPLEEEVSYIFTGGENFRCIDRITTLSTQLSEVSFSDTKEGAFAIRVARFLRFPTNPALNNNGLNGNYMSSEGIEGASVWGTRARWMNLYGAFDQDTISVVLMDHPSNLNYPTYWHARTYGLFSANPFGVKDFTGGEEELNFILKAGEKLNFRHRLYIKSGGAFQAGEVEQEWKKFSNLK